MKPRAAARAPADVVHQRRPVRGAPAATRERLVAAAAQEFEKHGYHGTDTNRIARAADYAPGTFYKHFVDKRAVFLAVYDTWVEREWRDIETEAREPGDRRARVTRIVDHLVEHHRRWRGFRAALRALIATDPDMRRHHRAVRARQLVRFRSLGPDYADPVRAALLMLHIERICDAIADEELAALGVADKAAKAAMVDELCAS
jgi:AcrR family transcriptional regulator